MLTLQGKSFYCLTVHQYCKYWLIPCSCKTASPSNDISSSQNSLENLSVTLFFTDWRMPHILQQSYLVVTVYVQCQACFNRQFFFQSWSFLDLASILFWSAVTPIPAIIDPTTQLWAITRNLMRYLLVVIAGPLFLYAIAPQTHAATVPAIPVIINRKLVK